MIVIHAALLAAVHAQPAPAVTPTLPLPPEAETGVLAGDIEYVHPLKFAVTLRGADIVTDCGFVEPARSPLQLVKT